MRILRADGFFARLTGLVGAPDWESDCGLMFRNCRSIHTFGMQFSLDVLFLDSAGFILNFVEDLPPNRTIRGPECTESVIEFRTGLLDRIPLAIGDRVSAEVDGLHDPRGTGPAILFHWPSNVLIALFWSRFVWTATVEWSTTPSVINLGLLIHNTLLMVLFLTRKRSKTSSHRFLDWLIPFFTVLCTLGLRAVPQSAYPWMSLTIALQAVGVAGMLVSLASLGRSFGIVPSNRTVKVTGAYRVVRHPLYLSELIFYAGFYLGNASVGNGILILIILTGQVWRAVLEERLLSRDPMYRRYLRSVRYRFIPGLY